MSRYSIAVDCFTEGRPFGAQDASLINPLQVPRGMPLGRVVACRQKGSVHLSTVELSRALVTATSCRSRPGSWREMIYSGPEASAGRTATPTTWARSCGRPGLAPCGCRAAERLSKSSTRGRSRSRSSQPESQAGRSDGAEAIRRDTQQPDAGRYSTALLDQSPIKWKAASIHRKTGDSGYEIRGYRFDSAPLFATAAQLNALRRQALRDFTAPAPGGSTAR